MKQISTSALLFTLALCANFSDGMPDKSFKSLEELMRSQSRAFNQPNSSNFHNISLEQLMRSQSRPFNSGNFGSQLSNQPNSATFQSQFHNSNNTNSSSSSSSPFKSGKSASKGFGNKSNLGAEFMSSAGGNRTENWTNSHGNGTQNWTNSHGNRTENWTNSHGNGTQNWTNSHGNGTQNWTNSQNLQGLSNPITSSSLSMAFNNNFPGRTEPFNQPNSVTNSNKFGTQALRGMTSLFQSNKFTQKDWQKFCKCFTTQDDCKKAKKTIPDGKYAGTYSCHWMTNTEKCKPGML